MIREAVVNDIPRIIDMVERLTASVAGPQTVDRIKTGETLCGLIASPDGAVIVSDGGFIAGQLMETVISRDPVAFELGWYADDRSGLRLLRAFEAWATGKGASLIKLSCNGGAAQTILERVGYRAIETAMVK